MTPIQLRSRVGADGVLTLNVPVGISEANREVRITVEAVEPSSAKPALSGEQWKQFIEETAGSITDPTFKRPEQGEYEERGEMFP